MPGWSGTRKLARNGLGGINGNLPEADFWPGMHRVAMIPNCFAGSDLRTECILNSIHSLHESALR
jgi:hypothetical protein